MDKGGYALLHFLHVRSFEIVHMVLHTDSFGRSMVLCCNEPVAGRALLQSWQHIEDAAPAVIQQQDAQVAAKVLVPQGILVVEETEVANDAEHLVVRNAGETCCRAERALDAIDTPIAEHGMLGIDICQTDGAAVSVMGGTLNIDH